MRDGKLSSSQGSAFFYFDGTLLAEVYPELALGKSL